MSRPVSERRAAIDVGTNSVRLLVADVHPDGRVCALIRKGIVTRLGQGLDSSGRIAEEPAGRTLQAIQNALEEARSTGARRVVLAATSALRSASNGPALAERIRQQTGVPVRILSGEEEARLVFRSIQAGRAPGEKAAVLDIGGGSTELAGGYGETLRFLLSLDLGCIRLYERALPLGGADTERGYEAIRELFAGELERAAATWRQEFQGARVRGVGGTLTAFGMLHLSTRHYDPERLDGLVLPAAEVRRIARVLRTMPLRERQSWVGEGRADLVPAGAAVLEAVTGFLAAPEVEISTRGLRYGLLLEPPGAS